MAATLSVASICRSLPTPDDSSGGIFVLRRLAAMARLANVHVVQPIPFFPVVAPLPQWARQSDRDVASLRIHHAPMFYIPKVLKSIDGYWLYRSVLGALTRANTDRQLDVVDAHFGFPEGVGAFLAAKKMGIPFFVTLRGFEAEYINKPIIGRQIKHVIRNSDGCICVSHFLRDLAMRHGASEDKTRVIHNGIDKDLFRPKDKSQARDELSLPSSARIVVSVGNLISRKRHHVLISAFARVLDKQSNALMLIAGAESFEADYPKKLRELVRELGIEQSVIFLGNVDAHEIATYLNAADVFALGTQREGCCNAVLEAVACGVPVVTTPVGDNSEFVKEGVNGYIVPVDDDEMMSEALTAALERQDWDKDRISSGLQVGNWGSVASQVLEFMTERTQYQNGVAQ